MNIADKWLISPDCVTCLKFECQVHTQHTCQLFLFWRNSSSFRSKKENDFIMCSCFCSNLCIVMYRKFRNVPLFKFFSLICSSFWNLKVGKYDTARFSLHQVHGSQCTKEYYTKYSWRTLADVCMVIEVLRVVPRCWVLL